MTAQAGRNIDRLEPTLAGTDKAVRPAPDAGTTDALLLAEMEAALLGDLAAEAAPRQATPSRAAAADPAAPPPVRLWPADEAAGAAPAATAAPPAVAHRDTAPAPNAPAPGRAVPVPAAPPAATVAADRLRADRGPPADAPADRDLVAPAAALSEPPAAAEDRWAADRRRGRRPADTGRDNGRRVAIAAGCILLAAGVAGALLLAIPDSDAPSSAASVAASAAGGGPATAADGVPAAPDGVDGARVVEAPRLGGARVEVAAPSADGTAPTAAPAEPAASPTTGDGAGRAAAPPAADVPVAAPPEVAARPAGAEPGSAELQQALVAAAAERARLAEMQGTQATGAPTLIDPTAAPPAADPVATPSTAATAMADGLAAAEATDAPAVDPGGFGAMPLPAPRQPGTVVAAAGAVDTQMEVATAAPDGPAGDGPDAAVGAAATVFPPAAEAGAPTAESVVATGTTATRTVRVSTAVNLRSGPDNGASTLTVIPAGSEVAVGSCDYWCEVEFGGTRGWVYKSFVGAP